MIAAPQIVVDDAGVAWIAGTTTKVTEVALHRLASGSSPEELQADLPHLTLPQVCEALAYYDRNRQVLDAEIERRRQWVEQVRAQNDPGPTREELLARKARSE
jgi:uncharacterized protein (DUF433 family)